MYNTAIRADRDIDAGFLEILVAGCSDFNYSRGLSASDALGFAGNADRTAADANLDKIRTGFRKEAETMVMGELIYE